jgi:hypothetical protein
MDYSWAFFLLFPWHSTDLYGVGLAAPGTSTQPQAATVAALVPHTATAGGAATRHGSTGSAGGDGVPQIVVTLPCNMSFEWERHIFSILEFLGRSDMKRYEQ